MIDPKFYSPDISLAAFAACGVALMAAIYLLSFLYPRLRRIVRRSVDDASAGDPDNFPPVSVVVCSQNDAAGLRELIPEIFGQDYPAPIEVIVVNDEECSSTDDVVKELQSRYEGLYLTFSPAMSRNLSRRKLALTIGIKAARHEHVVLTCGNCRIGSVRWLRDMMRHFADGKEIVLGYACRRGEDGSDNGRAPRRRAFDSAMTAARWISSALSGRPVRGTGYNLAYTRDLFFRHKGFSNSLGLYFGDDDVFVSEIADGYNCAVELSPDSIVEVREFDAAYTHDLECVRRAFTSGFLPQGGFRLFGSFSVAWWLWLLASCAGVVLSLPSFVGLGMVTVIALGLCLPMMFAWRNVCRCLDLRSLLLSVTWLSLWHPFYALKYKIRARRKKYLNYTWGSMR